MEEEKKEDVVVEDESVLDKELEESLNTMKAGKILEVEKPKVEPEVKVEESTKPKEESDGTAPKIDEPKIEDDFRIPEKGKTESDETYEKRIELFDLIKRRKSSKTDEGRQKLSDEIQTTRRQLGTLNGFDKINKTLNESVEPTKPTEEDETLKADRERLKELGGATKEDIEELLTKDRINTDRKHVVESFVGRHPELKDEDTREVLFDFIEANFNYQDKTGKDLMAILEMGREIVFKQSESIQERVLKGANVQEKVNAMQFPGGSVAKGDYSPEVRKSIDELKATGMSEEKALELLSE